MSENRTSLSAEVDSFFSPVIEMAQLYEPGAALAQRLHVDARSLSLDDLSSAILLLPRKIGQLDSSLVFFSADLLRDTLIEGASTALELSVISSPPDGETVFYRLFDLCFAHYISVRMPPLGGLFRVLGIIPSEDASPRLQWKRLSQILSSPKDWAMDTYGWGGSDPQMLQDALYRSMRELTSSFGGALPYSLDLSSAQAHALSVDPDHTYARLPLIQEDLNAEPVSGSSSFLFPFKYEAGLAILPYRDTIGRDRDTVGRAGIAIGAYSRGLIRPRQFIIDRNWSIDVAASGASDLGALITLSPKGQGIVDVSNADVSVSVSAALRYTSSEPITLIPSNTVVSASAAGFEIGVLHDGTEFSMRVSLRDVVLDMAGGSDGFLSKMLPEKTRLELGELGLQASLDGVSLIGGAGLVWQVPLPPRAGPVDISTATVTLDLDQLTVTATVEPKAKIGPVIVSVDRMGVLLNPILSDEINTPSALETTIVTPRGIGLGLDLGAVSGGGNLSYDPDSGRYSGALKLEVPPVALTAFGLLDTQSADGRDGWSLITFLSSEFSPIPIGFGFTLNGIGGLIGVNRGVDVDALFAAVRSGTARDIFAPANPMRDAARVALQVGSVFPVRQGQHVFGPTLRLGWGSPKEVISLDLGLAMTLPDPLRLVLVGTVRAILPDQSLAIARLNIDVAGVLDISASRFDMEGRIHDSVIQSIPVTGGFALRSSWGREKTFAFSIGGLHPGFEPPANFPEIDRMGVDLSRGSSFQFRLGGYFAITSNSLQLGARADLQVRQAGFTLLADVSFDALFVFDPFEMDLQISAGGSIKRGRRTLCSIRLEARLRGPAPWQISGSVSIRILFVKASISFSNTFGSHPTITAEAVDAEALIADAISEPRSWFGEGETGGGIVIEGLGDALGPNASLAVQQKVAPLGLRLDQIGGRRIQGARRFEIRHVRIGKQQLRPIRPVLEAFAPAQFIAMTDRERLTAPSFEDMAAGAVFADNQTVEVAGQLAADTSPESIILDASERVHPTPSRLRRVMRIQLEPITVRPAVSPLKPSPAVSVQPEGWVATDLELSIRGTGTYAQLRQDRPDAVLARAGEVTR